MPAPKKNQFWKLRSKHGRNRIIKEPDVLSMAADEYFQWCIDNPILEEDFMNCAGKPTKVIKNHPRAFKKNELARFCHFARWESISQLKDIKGFLDVITCIEGVIADQKYTYAVVGMFNSNIVARDLGLKDNTDITTAGKELKHITQVEIIKTVVNK